MPRKALLVIDVQKDVVVNALRIEAVSANINLLIKKARAASVPVIWVQHSDEFLVKGSEGWQIIDELQPQADEVRIYKTHPSSFDETNLAQELSRLGVDSLVVTGAQTDFCVNATSNAGVELGYQVTLVTDAHTTEDSETETAETIIQAKNDSFAALGQVATASQVTF